MLKIRSTMFLCSCLLFITINPLEDFNFSGLGHFFIITEIRTLCWKCDNQSLLSMFQEDLSRCSSSSVKILL